MSEGPAKHRRRIRWQILVLFGLFAGVVYWEWSNDSPSPAYPFGRFWMPILFESAIICVPIMLLTVAAFLMIRRRRGR